MLTTHIHEFFKAVSAVLDTNIYFTDDEMRKQAELLYGKIVVTGQEAVEYCGLAIGHAEDGHRICFGWGLGLRFGVGSHRHLLTDRQ